MSTVAYTFPSAKQSPRIAFVADCPKNGSPFSISESFLYNLQGNCKASGVDIRGCLLASVLQTYPGYVPTGADEKKGRKVIRVFDWSQHELATLSLEQALDSFEPDVIIPLGQLALRYFKRSAGTIEHERGAPFRDHKGRLCLATFHPRDLFIQHELTALVQFDIAKAKRLALEGWSPPEYRINYLPTFADVTSKLQQFAERKPYLAVDIETFYGTKDLDLDGRCTCIGLAYSTKDALVIPFVGKDGQGRYWSKDEEAIIWRLLNTTLRTCPLVGHNSSHFDFHMLAQHHGIIANFVDDTMFAHWSCYPEMSKSLSFCSSLYTDNPYWKDELKDARRGKIPRWKEFEYNGRDCIITMQVAVAIGKELRELPSPVRAHYKFNIRAARAYTYMSFKGARIDVPRLQEEIFTVDAKIAQMQELLNETLGRKLNVGSPKQVKEYLFGELGLPERKVSVKNPDGTQSDRTTADYLTTLYLARRYPDEPAIEIIGNLRKLKKRMSFLSKLKYDDNRICRWAFNVVGTETGRSSGYKPHDGLGIQPQNVDRNFRHLFLPPEGHHWVKADLEGADSVTVAACLEALGDPRLHADIKAGIKPAQTLALALALQNNGVMSWSIDKIKEHLQELKSTEGKKFYRIAKAINHGSAYLLSPGGMHTNIFKFSDGDLYILPKDCEAMQNLLFARYDYPAYHKQVRTIMNSSKTLVASSGQQRYFFGRNDNSTLRKMLAYLPQAHTAYVTNTVINRLYEDPNNRSGNNLFLQLCNQVHDETDFYLPFGSESKGHNIFYLNCQVPLKIWGVEFTIGFDAEYGRSWGELTNAL